MTTVPLAVLANATRVFRMPFGRRKIPLEFEGLAFMALETSVSSRFKEQNHLSVDPADNL
jgi:hypothetical protein